MNCARFIVTSDGLPSPLVYGEERDERSDSEKLRAAIEAYLEDRKKLLIACSGSEAVSEQLMALLEDREANSRGAMIDEFERIALVPWSPVEKAVMA